MKKSTDILNLYSGEMTHRAYERAAATIDDMDRELGFTRDVLLQVVTPILMKFPLPRKFEHSNVIIVYKERYSDNDHLYIGAYSDFDLHMTQVVGCLPLEDTSK